MNQRSLYIVAAIVFAMVFYIVSTRREGLDAGARTMADVEKDLAYMKSVGFKDDGSSDNATMQRLLAEKKTLAAASLAASAPAGAVSGLESITSTLRGYMTATVDSVSGGCSKPPASPGKDWSGATDIERKTANSADECATACCEKEGCQMYTYNGANKNCFLKKGTGTLVASIPQAFAGTVTQVSPGVNLLNNTSARATALANSTVSNIWSTLGDATSITSIAAITVGALVVGIMVAVLVYRAFFGSAGSTAPAMAAPLVPSKLV